MYYTLTQIFCRKLTIYLYSIGIKVNKQRNVLTEYLSQGICELIMYM